MKMIDHYCLDKLKESNAVAKFIVKKWEDTYKKNHGNRPSKEALREAPNEIKDAYKTYWRTSKQLSLLKRESTTSSDFENKVSNQEELTKLSIPFSCNINNDSDESTLKAEAVDKPNFKSQVIWGKHLNKRNICQESVTVESSLYSKMAENMKSHAVIKTRTSLKRMPSKTLNDSNDKLNVQPSLKATEVFDSEIAKDYSNIKDITNFENNDNADQFSDEVFRGKITEMNLPKHLNCVIKTTMMKANSQSVSHVSLGSATNGKMAVPRHWNKGWVRRCTGIADDGFDLSEEKNQISNTNQRMNIETNRLIESDNAQPDHTGNSLNYINEPVEARQMGVFEVGVAEISHKRKHCESAISGSNLNHSKRIKSVETKPKHAENMRSPDEADLNQSDMVLKYGENDGSELVHSPVNISDHDEGQNNSEAKPKRKARQSKQKTESPKMLAQKRKRNGTARPRKELEEENKQIAEKVGRKVLANREMFEYDEIYDMEKKIIKNIPQIKYLSKEERFHHKVKSGKVNENFVKINLKKKVFVRGKKRMTSEMYKRQEWKKRQIVKSAENGDEAAIKKLTCFRCGDFGHWANKCTGKIGDKEPLSFSEYDESKSKFLTVEEAADLAKGVKSSSENASTKLYINENNKYKKSGKLSANEASEDEVFSDWEEEFISAIKVTEMDPKCTEELSGANNESPSAIAPLYKVSSTGDLLPTPKEVEETLKLFGYNSFRKGQEKAIMRILCGQSTLVVQSTGSGKSLCYQLPAYLYAQHFRCITLCISPLVSLMEDQVTGLPSFLKAICLHKQQSSINREKALDALRSGNVHILLVSPEAIVSSRGGGVLGTLLKELPPIAFACLDEAHCLSEWSHNFRPSYLQVCKILKERVHVNTLLGLTATARRETVMSIAKQLQIPSLDEGIIMGTSIPENIKISVSRDVNREEALIHLLVGDRFQGCSAIIIYCTRREECERIATFIRTQMMSVSRIDVKSNAKKRRGLSLDAEAYHAGLSGYRRQQIQKCFMSGKLRIVVATVAFGMGIDKADVEGIIHFNMPRNLESYAQEIGRAGRNGNIAHCHLFLDSADGKDIRELKRHIFANSVDRFTVRKLLNKVFVPRSCIKGINLTNFDSESNQDIPHDSIREEKTEENITEPIYRDTEAPVDNSRKLQNAGHCLGHEVALPIEELIELLDLPEENIQTLLCYLESQPGGRLKLFHHVYATCKVLCYGGPKQLCAVSRKCPPLAVAIALQRKKGKTFNKVSSVTFPVVDIASQMGWESRIVKQELKKLEWNTVALKKGGNVRSSGVRVEFCDLAFHVIYRCDLTEEEQDQVLEEIYERACTQERDQLKQLQFTYEVLRQSSTSSIVLRCDAVDEEKSLALKKKIANYFSASNGGGFSSVRLEEQLYLLPEVEQRIRSDIRSLLSIHSDQSWTGRAVSRVLHGITSPNFPASVWGKVKRFWRLHLHTDFNLLVAIATKEILRFK